MTGCRTLQYNRIFEKTKRIELLHKLCFTLQFIGFSKIKPIGWKSSDLFLRRNLQYTKINVA